MKCQLFELVACENAGVGTGQCLYSSGQNKVPTAEWKSRLIVAQSENRFCLAATLVTFFSIFLSTHTLRFSTAPAIIYFRPALLVSRPNSRTLLLTSMLPSILR